MNDSYFLEYMNSKVKLFRRLECRVVDIFFFICVTVAAVALRFSLRETVSGDYVNFLKPWYDQIKGMGWSALGQNIGDYSPLYMYFFTLFTFLPLDSLAAIKLLTVLFDFVAAGLLFAIVYRFSHSFYKATAAWGALLFLPSVVLNGAVWAQCDIIYTLFMILSLDLVHRGRQAGGCAALGIAFCFKLQAVFFIPVLLIYWLKGKLKFPYLFLIPACYLVSVIPALIAGRGFLDVMKIYFNQMGTYTRDLTYNFPNIYCLVGNKYLEYMSQGAVLLTFALLGFLFYYLFRNRFRLTWELGLLLSVFVLLLIPYFLPYMHERYAFPADIFALLLFLCYKKYFWVVLSTQLLTLLAYQPFLLQNVTVERSHVAIAYLAFLGVLARVIYKRIQASPPEPEAQAGEAAEPPAPAADAG